MLIELKDLGCVSAWPRNEWIYGLKRCVTMIYSTGTYILYGFDCELNEIKLHYSFMQGIAVGGKSRTLIKNRLS